MNIFRDWPQNISSWQSKLIQVVTVAQCRKQLLTVLDIQALIFVVKAAFAIIVTAIRSPRALATYGRLSDPCIYAIPRKNGYRRQEGVCQNIVGSNPRPSRTFFPHKISIKVLLYDHLIVEQQDVECSTMVRLMLK